MKRFKWAFLRAVYMGFGLATGRAIIDYFLEPRPFNTTLVSISVAFTVGFVMGLPFWYLRFPGNEKETEKQND